MNDSKSNHNCPLSTVHSKLNINQWAEADRPREKMMTLGAEALSNAELLAILIGSGSTEESAVDLMKRVLNDCKNNLNSLGKLSVHDLCAYNGIGEAKAITILAACELGKRRQQESPEERPKLETHIKNKRLDFARMLGGKENPFPYLRQADLFVSASLTESYGLSAQEALVLGIPVVAVGCRGIRESLGDCFGLLVDNSAAALAEGIRTMLQTPGMLEQYRDTIARDYPADRLFGERLEAIMELLEQDPGACPER